MTFASREDAGHRLARRLMEEHVDVDLVAGLPRGGVVVAAEIADALRCPLRVLAVRKIGHPWHREFAVGALAEGGVVVLDHKAIGRNVIMGALLDEVIKEETERLKQYTRRFHRQDEGRLETRRVLIVDDGLATGATTEAAVLSAHKQGAIQVVVAAPVASTTAVERLTRVADAVIVLEVDPGFDAVGSYYVSFPQTTDEQVLALLRNPHRLN